MTPTPISPSAATASGAPGRPAESPEDAARQFEAVLVRQFVEVMTKDLFDGDAEGGLTGQADLQRDTLTDTLTDHLVESGTFGVADLMIAQWKRAGRVPDDAPADPASAPPASAASRAPDSQAEAPRPMTMDEALRRYPLTKSTRTTQGPSVSYDPPQDPVP